MNKPKKIVVACGGTGGHVFPGLAVANELKRRGHAVEVWFSGRAIEAATHAEWDGDTFATGARQLSLQNAPHMIRAFFRCAKAIKGKRPDALLAMGSYSSLPPVLAAWLHRVPVVLHEGNAVPGKAVDALARFAHTVATSFDETAAWFPRRRVVKTGLPVREALAGQPPLDGIPEGAFTVLITGGSQGAHRVNQLTAQAMCLLQQEGGAGGLFVIHQTGAADEAWVREAYAKAGVPAHVSAFITEMGRAYAAADFVICRAGVSTCLELCLLGKPALLIPLPSAIRDHQHLNAAALVRTGGADEGIQRELTGRSIMRYVQNKRRNPAALEKMGQALKALSPEGAATRVAEVVESVTQIHNA
ncbi:MAG: UDP-N-acetylglucosamine--N-acetylmuramyl-(pentapeptide) pyrophosphoryl-undecaprenol N-acetylglucosamine transferase [Kiritimatiellaeota bacterium]|nr:UDP-N-acetylglucosamine--N-acetylmuramyl-(pentapeptide) pyrophosphoryl-undecaprenol N-acetylglucosamine transferase [Kiritimatiellota bacterium]